MSGLPALPLWEKTLNRPQVVLDVYQDNQATARIMSTGRAPTLRHIKRTHTVSIAWLHERVTSPNVRLHDCISNVMAADIFKKHFISRENGSNFLNSLVFVRMVFLHVYSPLAPASLPPCYNLCCCRARPLRASRHGYLGFRRGKCRDECRSRRGCSADVS